MGNLRLILPLNYTYIKLDTMQKTAVLYFALRVFVHAGPKSRKQARMAASKSQTPKELKEYGKQDGETDLEWAERVSGLYDPTLYTSDLHCEHKPDKKITDQTCYCLLPTQSGLQENGDRHVLSGSYMKYVDVRKLEKEGNSWLTRPSDPYNCTQQMNLCHHMLHYDSVFTDGPVMLEELVGGGLMTKFEMEQCFMRSFYYGMKNRQMSIEYLRHLIGVHAHYDLSLEQESTGQDDE